MPQSSVMEGKNGWLFLKTFEKVDAMKLYTDPSALSDYIFRRWTCTLEKRQRWFGERGIHLVTQFVPETCVVYPEMLPDDVRLLPLSPYERLLPYLTQELARQIIYPRQALTESRGEYETYNPIDSHWNVWGAYIGYRLMMEKVRERLPHARLIEPHEITWRLSDTAGFLGGLMNPKRSCRSPVVKKITRSRRHTSTIVDGVMTVENEDDSLPTALIFRDSFATAMGQFLSESFHRATYVFSHAIYYDLVEQLRPDVVIYQRAERGFHYPPVEPDAQDARAVFGDLQLGDERAVAAQQRSRGHLASGKATEALDFSEAALSMAARDAPGRARALVHRSRIYGRLGNPQAALECLSHARALEPDAAIPAMLAGELERSSGRSRQGLLLLKRAAELEPGVPRYWETLAAAQLEDGDLPGARDSLQKSLDIDDCRLEPHLLMSRAMAQLKNFEMALQHAEVASQIDADNRYVVANLVSVLIQKADWRRAHSLMKSVVERFPGNADFSRYLALCEARMAGAGVQ